MLKTSFYFPPLCPSSSPSVKKNLLLQSVSGLHKRHLHSSSCLSQISPGSPWILFSLIFYIQPIGSFFKFLIPDVWIFSPTSTTHILATPPSSLACIGQLPKRSFFFLSPSPHSPLCTPKPEGDFYNISQITFLVRSDSSMAFYIRIRI